MKIRMVNSSTGTRSTNLKAKMLTLKTALLVFFFGITSCSALLADQNSQRSIFEKRFDSGWSFKVTISDAAKAVDLGLGSEELKRLGISPSQVNANAIQVYVLAAVFCKDNVQLPVWSQMFPLTATSSNHATVLDALSLPGRIVFVTVGGESDITVHDLCLSGGERVFGLRGADYSLLAAARPTEAGRFSSSLQFESSTKSIRVVVVDRASGAAKKTIFREQSGDSLEFVPEP